MNESQRMRKSPELDKQNEVSISPLKKKVFLLAMILTQIIILVGTETILRAIHYGGNLDLVVKTTVMGKEYYTLNREVARRYFSQKGINVPEAYDDIFEIQKQPHTKRIFMLGESTMAGFPFDYNATAPRLLRDRLVQLLSQYNIEVINVGLAAINSYTVLDFMEELVSYEPDAFIIYLGHNEFYGAMGIGSTEYLGQWRWLVHLYLELRSLKLFLLIRDGIVALRNIFVQEPTPREATLMEVMVREKAILYNSRGYRIAKENFTLNLIDIIAVAKNHRVPIVLSTLTSNIRDQKPLLATFSESATSQSMQMWRTIFDKGKKAQEVGNFEEAISFFQQAIQINTLHADAHYHLAKCLDTLRRYNEAKLEYKKARDYDGLRFRASSDFNDLIRSLCRQEVIPVADAEVIFEQHSPHGLVGSNLMLEHLHPNFDGYFLLAKTFFQTLVDDKLIVSEDEWQWERNLNDAEFKERAGVTEFELEAAQYRIQQLTSGWPFTNESSPKPRYQPQNKIQEIAVAYARKRIAWSQAHYELADWYAKDGKYEKALREFFAVSKVIPYYYYPVMRMGDMYRLMEKSDLAEQTYRRALGLQNSPFVRVRLGMLYYDVGKTEQAIDEFEITFVAEQAGSEKMSTKERSTARYLLAVAYGKHGNLQKAKENLQLALEIDPQNDEARKLLTQLSMKQ